MMALWLGLPKWGRDALMIVGAIVLAIITGKFIIARHDDRIRKEVNDARDREALKEQQRVDQTRREITQENQNASQAVDDAVHSLPTYRHTDELRARDPDLAAIVLGDSARRGS